MKPKVTLLRHIIYEIETARDMPTLATDCEEWSDRDRVQLENMRKELFAMIVEIEQQPE